MKFVFDINASYSIRKLEAKDLAAYQDFCKTLPNPDRYQSYLDNDAKKLVGLGSHYHLFALWSHDKIIGQSMIAFDPDAHDKLAVYCETEISPDYRGKGLSRYLHNARTRFLEERDFEGVIETHIKADNMPSIRAAARQGFKDTGETIKGFQIFRLG